MNYKVKRDTEYPNGDVLFCVNNCVHEEHLIMYESYKSHRRLLFNPMTSAGLGYVRQKYYGITFFATLRVVLQQSVNFCDFVNNIKKFRFDKELRFKDVRIDHEKETLEIIFVKRQKNFDRKTSVFEVKIFIDFEELISTIDAFEWFEKNWFGKNNIPN